MSFRKWVEDTEALFRLMPANSPIKHRLEELIINARDFALIGHTLDMVKIDLPEIEVPGKTFFVLERPLEFSHIGETVEHVTQLRREHFPTCIFLPQYDPNTPILNGMTLAHSLVHVEQTFRPDDRLLNNQEFAGRGEQEAWGLNYDMLKAVDGEALDRYFKSINHDINYVPSGTGYSVEINVSFDHQGLIPPPEGSLLRQLWDEGETAKRIVVSMSLYAAAVEAGKELPSGNERVGYLAIGLMLNPQQPETDQSIPFMQ